MPAGTSGTVALVGSGEFLPLSDPLDQVLLARLPGPPQVVVLPTASAPDGPGVPERWARMGVEHFTRLGVAVTPVLLRTRADAESPTLAAQIAAANFVYLSGGKPQYLLQTLHDTVCWEAIAGVFAAGGVVAGCSAGAMALAGAMFEWPQLWRTRPGLGLAPGLAVIPHFDELPGGMKALLRRAPRPVTIVGVEAATGLVGAGREWTVYGRGSVTVFTPGHEATYHSGERVVLAPGA
jgi:cyanophycinase